MSALSSGFIFAFPYLFPQIIPEGTLPYFLITIPMAVVPGVLAWRAGSRWLIVFAIVAGLSPLLLTWVFIVLLKVLYVVTGGRYPGAEWL